MQRGGNFLKSGVIRKVERIVCGCVNEAFSVITMGRYRPVYVPSLYDGVTNIPFARRIARGAVFSISHDRFGVSYSDIAAHSKISCRNIIRSARSYKDMSCFDCDVRKINELIESELEKFPIL